MRLFESDEKDFNTLGICSLNQCLSCTITEELNGSYELVMTYHMDSKGFKELKLRRIIYAKPNPYSLEQPFRIYAISTPINRVVTVNASHISYDLSGYVVEPFNSTSIYEVVNSIKAKTLVEVPFSFYVTGDLDPGEIKLKAPESVRSIIGNHILKVHKPEIEYNQNEVYFRQRRGSDNGVTIRYGKNLLDISHNEDCINVYTDVYPFWHGTKYDVESEDSSEKEILVTLPDKLLKVNESFEFTNVLILDLSSDFQEEPTEDQLKEATEKYIKDHKIGEPTVSITVDFIQLTSSEEYNKYRLLDKVMLGDDVIVEFTEANIYATSRCIKTTYSPILNKYTEIELGETTPRLTDRIANDKQENLERNDKVVESQKGYIDKALADITNTSFKMAKYMLEGGILSSTDGQLQISLEDDYFELAHPDANTKTRLDEEGFYILDRNRETIASLASKDSWSSIVADTVFASNIENIYMGDANLYVDHSKSGSGSGTIDNPFTDFKQLKDYLEYTPIINKDVTINVVSVGEVSDNLDLRGLRGRGVITIVLDKNLTLVSNGQSLYGLYFYACSNRILVTGGRSSNSSIDGALINKFGIGVGFDQCKFGEVEYIAIDTAGRESEQRGVFFRNTNGTIGMIDFVDSYNAVFADLGSNIYEYDSCGNCTNSYYSMRSATIMFGVSDSHSCKPKGDLLKISGDIVSIGNGAYEQSSYRYAPPVPVTSIYTQSFGATGFGTYQYAWNNWASGEWGNRAIQGVWNDYGNKAGHIFFDMSSIRSFIGSGTVQSATITLTRRNAGGYRSSTNIYLNGSNVSSAAGTPSYSNHTHIGSLSWGEKKTFTVPNSILVSIKNGTANSLACCSDSYTSAYAEIVDATLTIKVKK